jgi:hypothetical protein
MSDYEEKTPGYRIDSGQRSTERIVRSVRFTSSNGREDQCGVEPEPFLRGEGFLRNVEKGLTIFNDNQIKRTIASLNRPLTNIFTDQL